jgi:SAM-dependent methyltransferase
MTEIDVEWFKRCYAAGLVKDRMLEVGAARIAGNANLCDIARKLGIQNLTGADLEKFDGVDIAADFGLSKEAFGSQWCAGTFSTVCVFNVLEHTFDPVTVLTNALSCLESGGSMLVVTPSIWPIHNFPGDFTRLLPDWYASFAERHQITLLNQQFCWLSQFGIETINIASDVTFPSFLTRPRGVDKFRYWASRIGHKLLNTYGRSHWATHSAIAAAFVRQ